MLKICNNIYTSRFLSSSSIHSSKNKHHQTTFKSKFQLFVRSETFIKFILSSQFNTSFIYSLHVCHIKDKTKDEYNQR